MRLTCRFYKDIK